MVPGPGEQGQDHPRGRKTLTVVETLLDVVVEVHPGLEAVTGLGDTLDDLVGLGELFAIFGGDGQSSAISSASWRRRNMASSLANWRWS